MNLSINKITENKFEVKIYGNSVTVHQVIISEDIYLRLTNSKISKEKLLEFSFAFLICIGNSEPIFSARSVSDLVSKLSKNLLIQP